MAKANRNEEPKKQPAPVVDVPASICHGTLPNGQKCGSTRRTEYHGVTRTPLPGEHADGSHDEAVFRRCECLDCGQHRVDRTVERTVDPAPAD